MIITKRIAPIYWDNPMGKGGSLRITLTSELVDIGIDPINTDLEKVVTASVIDENGVKKIVIEAV